jgi:CubicO group peptidase (beta-lactamase class C family)
MKMKLIIATFALLFLTLSSLAQTKSPTESKLQIEKVDAFVREKMTANHIPGLSLAIVRDGKIMHAKGFGMANLELSVPATEKTNYPITSITKTFTAIATMMLVEESKVSLEDPISKHFADLPVTWRSVTIRQLLNHTSGISSFTNHKKIPCSVGKDVRDYQQGDVLKEVVCLPLDFTPGERWAYGDTGYYLLGMLIEKVSGKGYEQFLRERIFTPLGMTETRLINYTELIPNRADGYDFQNGSFRNETGFEINEFGNAGLVSTVLDMAKLDGALYREKLLKRATLEQMWTNAKLNNGEIVQSYGLGFGLTPFRGHRRVGHSGGGGLGFATTFTRFIDDKITVIILSNANQEGFVISDMANEIASFYFPN